MATYRCSLSGTARVYSAAGYYAEVVAGGYVWATIPATLGDVSFFTVGTIDLSFDPSSLTPTTTSGDVTILGYTWSVTRIDPQPTTYSVTCQNDGHGTLSASPSSGISAGTTVTLSPSASSGYTFDHYTISPSRTITNNKFTMPSSNVTVKAFFKKVYTKVTAGNYIKATDRSQTGTSTTAGTALSDSHFSSGESASASTFNSRVLS